MTQTFMLFHVNLAYSAIAESSRAEVIEKCYYPMLKLITDTNIPIGIELTGWTLRQIQAISPEWVFQFKKLLQKNKCELIGSGYTQLIGPLVPYEVNVWNQQLGLDDYQQILGVKPQLALVNEMAYSTGLVEVYAKAGYKGIIMDRDNVRLALGRECNSYESVPSHAKGLNNTSIPVLWSDSLLFQKLQHYVHGDSRLCDYIDFFQKRITVAKRPLSIYCNDVEIFNYRPGRYSEERPAHEEGEWKRLTRLLTTLTEAQQAQWLLPSVALEASLRLVPESCKVLSSIYQPIPVKKQAKYNISRWAVTGQNDLWINTMCHRIYGALSGTKNSKNWCRLCDLWASDLRTHIKAERWQAACKDINEFIAELDLDEPKSQKSKDVSGHGVFAVSKDNEGIFLTVRASHLKIVFNLRRGLAIHSLAYASQNFEPVVGTIPHGYFDSIKYGADFYTGGIVAEIPEQHCRITDLERVEPIINLTKEYLSISCKIKTTVGYIVKHYYISTTDESVTYGVKFPDWKNFKGILRVGITTLLPDAFGEELMLKTVNGGSGHESYIVDQACEHTHPGSTLVSSSTGFGSTTGEIVIGDKNKALKFSWDPAQCAAFPMLIHQKLGDSFLCRLLFSLAELDESCRERTVIPSFTVHLSPFYSKSQNRLTHEDNKFKANV